MKLFRIFLCVVAIYAVTGTFPNTASAQDAINLHQAQITGNSPADIADWPATIAITNVTIDPAKGVSFKTTAIPQAWQAQIFNPQDTRPCPVDGCLQYTVWPVVQVQGKWMAAGIIQMWEGRDGTGAAILNGWQNWWGPAGSITAGVFGQYVPAANDSIGFFLSAANARGNAGVTSVRERSNVVEFKLPAGDTGSFDFPTDAPQPTPEPTPQPGPTTPDLDALTQRVSKLETFVTQLAQSLEDVVNQLASQVDVLNKFANDTSTRVSTLEAKPVLAQCHASVLGISIHCSLAQ